MSQEYTPVDWVDETTSQQGTLINAERLDQMQTAHHYADGFEEVDAIPTEDPGVDYHKVVYCTADTTFYRWDGTQWTADIDEDTKRLLDQEIARATAAEGELAQDIEDEATARAQADTALGERITAETGAREGADTALGARIDAEAEYRADVDRQIYADIGRLNGETLPLHPSSRTPTIQNAIAANEGNISNLTSVVDGLSYDLGQEVTDRENADTGLAADITAEVQARAAAIASLQAGVYTKTEADNLLAAKADVTALTDGSVTKVGTADLGTDTKPIKLVAGVPTAVGHDLVTTDTAQTIPGEKQLLGAYTFKKYLVTYGGATAGYRKLWTFSGRGVFNIGTHSVTGQLRALSSARYLVEFYRSTFDSTDNKQTRIYTTANTSAEEMVVGANINPAEGEGNFAIYGYMVAGSSAEFLIDTAYNEDGTFKTNFAESSDTTVYDLATIGATVPVADPYNLGAALDGYEPMVRTTGNQAISGTKQYNNDLSRGCTSANVLTNPATAIGATILSMVDQSNGTTHNSLGSISKVRNANNQNYIDLENRSYGYNDGVDQWITSAFLRILIDESTGGVQLILYRGKRKTSETNFAFKSKVIESIGFSE